MVIVSQDKRIITNFDKTLGIQIEEHIKNSDGEKDYEIQAITERRTCNLGTYDKEEKAKKVLKKLIQTIEDTSTVNLMENLQISIHNPNFGGSLSSVYYMPEDKED